MASIWLTSITADSITLNNGQVIDLSSIPGKGWPAAKLEKARALIQSLVEGRIAAADIPPDEETLGWTDAQMQAVYGERMLYDKGDLVSRSTIVDDLAWDEVNQKLFLTFRSP